MIELNLFYPQMINKIAKIVISPLDNQAISFTLSMSIGDSFWCHFSMTDDYPAIFFFKNKVIMDTGLALINPD